MGPWMAKVIVLGLDGLDIKFLSRMPNLRNGMRVFRSDPLIPLTYTSWSSIMTGVNPGKHGLMDFFIYRKVGGSWRARVASFYDLGHPRIDVMINMVTRSGGTRFAIVNPVPSYPLPRISKERGLLISFDFFAPSPLATDKASAERYYDFEEYTNTLAQVFRSVSCGEKLANYKRLVEMHKKAVKLLSSNYDLVWVNVPLPDNYFHLCEDDLIREHGRVGELLSSLDELVAAAYSETDNLIIISDHGFRVYDSVVSLNALLYREGLVTRSRDVKDEIMPLEGSLVTPAKTVRISPGVIGAVRKVLKGPLRSIARGTYLFTRKLLTLFGRNLVYARTSGVDIHRSPAFAPVWYSNDTPRYLVLLNDPSVESRVVNIFNNAGLQAYLPKELLWGPYADFPGVIVYGRIRHPTAGTIYNDPIVEKPIAQHRRYGVLAIKSDAISVEDTDILPNYLVTPMVLCLLGLPLGKNMDGLDLLSKICGVESSGTYNYGIKWRILKKTMQTMESLHTNKGPTQPRSS
jgi:hypothetical protein